MSKINRTSNIFRVLVVALVVGTLASCMKTGTGNNSNSNNVSFITLMHMAPYSPSMEVYFNGIKQTSAIPAGTFSTSYGKVTPGDYEIKFQVAGSDSVLSVLSASPFDSLGFYTLILFNKVDSSVGSMKIVDDYSSLSLTAANYRFFNLSPDAPTVDLAMNSSLAQTGRGLADNYYGGSYFNSFQPVAAGSYSLQAKKAGTDSVVATSNSVNLQAGAAYTIFLSGKKNSSTNPITLNVLQAAY
jgi:hypothetical protein